MATALSFFPLLDPVPTIAPGWSLAVYDTLRAPGAVYYPYLKLGPMGAIGTKYYAGVGVSSPSLGAAIAGRVKVGGWPSNLKWGFTEMAQSLSADRHTIQFDDTDSTWAAIVDGANAGSVVRAPAMIGLCIPSLPAGLWPTLFGGVIEWAGYSKIKTAQVTIRRNDFWLNSLIPRRLINNTFTTVVNSIGLAFPLVFGTFDSTGNFGTAKGAIPCISLTAKRYLICIGRIQNAVAPVVYLGGVLQGSGYTINSPIINGVQCTTVDFTSAQTSAVTVDVTGAEDIGDGTGVPLQTWGQQLLFLLQNFAIGNYMRGLWTQPDPTIFDLDSFYAVDDQLEGSALRPRGTGVSGYSTFGRQTARYVSTQVRAIDELNASHDSFSIKPIWLPDGRLSVKMISSRIDTQKVYVDRTTHFVNIDAEQIGDTFQQVSDPNTVVDWIQGQYSSDASQGKKQNLMDIRDLFAGWQVVLQKNSSWSIYQTAQSFFCVPISLTFLDANASVSNAADATTCVDQPPGIATASIDEGLSQVVFSGAANYNEMMRFKVSPLPPLLSISKVIVTWIARWSSNGGTGPTRSSQAVYKSSGGTQALGTAQAGGPALTTQSFSWTWTTNPVTTVAWTKDDIESGEWGVQFNATRTSGTPDGWAGYAVSVQVFYQGEPSAGPMVRECRTRDMVLLRAPIPVTLSDLPIWRGAITPGDLCAISYSLANGPGGTSWGVQLSQQRLHMLMSHECDLNEAKLRLKSRFVDMRKLCPTNYETDLTDLETGYLRPGIGIMNQTREAYRAGGPLTRYFTRSTVGYPFDPADGRIFENGVSIESYDVSGLRIQGASSNLTPYSDTFSTLAWTQTPATGCAIGYDDSFTPDAFDPNNQNSGIPANRRILKMTMASSIPAADNQLPLHVLNSVASVGIIRIVYFNDQGNPFYWCFQRSTDSKWWRDSDQTWQTAKTFNPLSSTAGAQVQVLGTGACVFTSRYIGGFTPTIDGFQVVQPGTTNGAGLSVASQSNHLYEIDIWASRFAFEVAPSGGTGTPVGPTARSADILAYTCTVDATVWPIDFGTWFCLFVPDFNSADLINGDVCCLITALAGAGASNNFDDIRYTASGPGTGTLAFRRSVDGSVTSATIANPVFTRGVPVIIGARWTGLNGELGLPNFSQDVFFGAPGSIVKGTTVTGGQQRFTTPYTVYVGSDGSTVWANGFFQFRKGYPMVWSDVEILRQPA
jgi:hypothetical protein